MITPALLEASTDDQLKGAPKEVFLYLHGRLSYGEYRPLKPWVAARELKMKENTVGRAMKRLVERGYIRQGRREKPGGRSYLLLTSRGETLKKTA